MSASCKTCGDTKCETRRYNLDICLSWKQSLGKKETLESQESKKEK